MNARVPEPHLSAWRALLNAHASVVGRIEEALANAGLPPLAWYDVLGRCGARRGGSAHGRARRRPHAELGAAYKLVDRLESAGLLRRERAEDDGRGFYAALTDAGEAMLRRMWPVYARILREALVDTLSDEEAAVIAAGLARANDAVAALPAEPT